MGFKMKYEITYDLLPISNKSGKKRRQGRKASCEFGSVHDTGVINSTDEGNINWAKRTLNDGFAWANFFCDYNSIRVCIPCFIDVNVIERACSVNKGATLDNQRFGKDANDAGVSGEMCYFSNVDKTLESYNRFVFMWAYLGYFHKWKERFGTISGRLIGHFQLQPHNRKDPMNAFSYIGKTWEDFLNDVDKEYEECLEGEDSVKDNYDIVKGSMKVDLYGSIVEVDGFNIDGHFYPAITDLFGKINDYVYWDGERHLIVVRPKKDNED